MSKDLYKKSYLFWIIFGVVIAVGILAGALYFYVSTTKSREAEQHLVTTGAKALPPPEFKAYQANTTAKINFDWDVKTLSGEQVLMSQFKDKVLFLHFWASWCLPCHREMPLIQKLYDNIKDKVAFACISSESVETINKFLSSRKYSFPIYKIEGTRPDKFKSLGNPATIIINKEGHIVFEHSGAADWGHEESIAYFNNLVK
ncbi:redoxin domain-containing protein [candidate division CSSED10-310 bacterium]|uniref:Redoxin domain-containing protein n=1 Tax=candidate division CSSED10-310 bacterium TaxID=2855610 RepID=A0ABV6YT92_UNCC1